VVEEEVEEEEGEEGEGGRVGAGEERRSA